MGEKTNLYFLTGFLGSGKTTLLLKLLNEVNGEKTGVIQNEFGKLGIDGEILRNDDIKITEINRGSIFCSCLKLNFAHALADMADYNLKYLFVESSGLADPSNVEEILEGVKVMKGDFYDFKGVICLIDAVNFLDQLKDLETVNRQLKHCHLAIVNKTDLIDKNQLYRVLEAVANVNPVCRVITCEFGDFGQNLLQENLLRYTWAECEDTTNSEDTKPKTLFMNYEGIMKREVLQKFLDSVMGDCYRIKGFFHLEDGWNQVDVVGNITDYKPCEPKEKSQLVIISKVGPKIIRPLVTNWQDITGEKLDLKN